MDKARSWNQNFDEAAQTRRWNNEQRSLLMVNEHARSELQRRMGGFSEVF
jgi:hypothetical protein